MLIGGPIFCLTYDKLVSAFTIGGLLLAGIQFFFCLKNEQKAKGLCYHRGLTKQG